MAFRRWSILNPKKRDARALPEQSAYLTYESRDDAELDGETLSRLERARAARVKVRQPRFGAPAIFRLRHA